MAPLYSMLLSELNLLVFPVKNKTVPPRPWAPGWFASARGLYSHFLCRNERHVTMVAKALQHWDTPTSMRAQASHVSTPYTPPVSLLIG